jgi:hypothetical protein
VLLLPSRENPAVCSSGPPWLTPGGSRCGGGCVPGGQKRLTSSSTTGWHPEGEGMSSRKPAHNDKQQDDHLCAELKRGFLVTTTRKVQICVCGKHGTVEQQ